MGSGRMEHVIVFPGQFEELNYDKECSGSVWDYERKVMFDVTLHPTFLKWANSVLVPWQSNIERQSGFLLHLSWSKHCPFTFDRSHCLCILPHALVHRVFGFSMCSLELSRKISLRVQNQNKMMVTSLAFSKEEAVVCLTKQGRPCNVYCLIFLCEASYFIDFIF